MAHILKRDGLDCDNRLVEEKFLFAAQADIQKLLNEKKLRYRDLSKRLGVSEARVSQMFGDEANLTIRTIARIYHCLGETPVLTTRATLDHALGARGVDSDGEPEGDWELLASDLENFEVANAHASNEPDIAYASRAPKNRDWIVAAHALRRRA